MVGCGVRGQWQPPRPVGNSPEVCFEVDLAAQRLREQGTEIELIVRKTENECAVRRCRRAR